jgi:hypothetical protein
MILSRSLLVWPVLTRSRMAAFEVITEDSPLSAALEGDPGGKANPSTSCGASGNIPKMSTEGGGRVTDDEASPKRARGNDEPATEDLLDRGPLARAIADVISNTPPDSGVRVGVFGEWGSGKSSVLNFVERLLLRRGYSVVRFSPWGVSEPDELWFEFGKELASQLGKKGAKTLAGIKFKYSGLFERGVAAGQELVAGAGRVIEHDSPLTAAALSTAAVPALGWFGRLFKPTKRALPALAKSGERIVVMIDDVDRTDPNLVPPILFALREIFLDRFSWILAIDPVVVRAALKRHHPGFALGRDYLEKVVEFPFILKGPAPSARVQLVERDLREHPVIADLSIVREISELLPENPRELRAIVRNLRSIERTIARFGPEDELDERLLIALVTIHTAAPMVLLKLLESKEAFRRITGARRTEDKKAEQAARKKAIRAFLRAAGARREDRPRIERLLLHLAGGMLWARETVAATADLLYTAPVMTAREASEGFAKAADARTLDDWLGRFAEEHDRTQSEVRKAFYKQLLQSHNRAMNEASGSHPADGVRSGAARVVDVIKVVEMLLFELDAVTELGAEGLRMLRSAINQWAHFVNPPYAQARQEERRVLLRFANDDRIDPLAALDLLAPRWHSEDDDNIANPGEAARRRLNLELVTALEERAAKAFVDLVDTVPFQSVPERAREHLLRRHGLLWSSEFRSQLRRVFDRAPSDTLSYNARRLLRAALQAFPESAAPPAQEPDLVELLWGAIVSVVPNMRMFESRQQLKTDAERLAGKPLTEPPWWDGVKAEYLATKARVEATAE